jgi:hypothetical protein
MSAALAGNGTGGAFIDSLEAALAPQSAPGGTGVLDASQAMFGKAALSKLKTKLKGADAALALTPQQLQQQAFLQKLQSGNSGINIAALRMALAKGGQATSQPAPGQQPLPVLDPVTGKVKAAKPATPSDASTAQGADAASQMMALQQPTNPAVTTAAHADAPAPADSTNTSGTNTGKPSATPADTAKDAAHAASQTKLASALVQAAQAPVVKTGQDDGSKVPNAKIAKNDKAPAKDSAKTDAPLTDPAAIQALGAKIAATAGATNPSDTAHVAARNVALAEVAAQQAAATPTVTKLESAAMTNAAQVATHQTTPEQKVEAQALPIQFGVQQADAKDGNTGPQNDKSGTGDKDSSQRGNAHLSSDTQKTAAASAPQSFVPTQQSAAPAHTATASTTTANTDAGNGNAIAAAPVQTAPVATTLQVSQQPPQQRQDPMPDQTAFAALGVAIATRSKDGARQFDINMHPADLGKIDVRISVDSSGQAQAHLTAEHPQTLQLLKQDQTTLAQNLRDAGLNLANNGLNFSLKGEQQSSTPTFNTRSRALSIAAVQTPDIVSTTSSSANIAPGDSRLDIRV